VNWEPTAAALIQWLHRDVMRGVGAPETGRLLEELLSYPDVPRQWRMLDLDAARAPFLAVELAKGDVRLSFFSLLAGLGVPYDITLHELRVECLLPGGPDERGAAAPARGAGRVARRPGRPALEPAPDFSCGFHAQRQLRALLLHADVVALDGGREAALRAHAELVQRQVPRGLVEAALEIVLAFEGARLARDQAEHHARRPRHVAERREIAERASSNSRKKPS
jgi:hypothetical protein